MKKRPILQVLRELCSLVSWKWQLLLLVLMTAASLLEGFGFALFLPLAQLVGGSMSGAAGPSPAEGLTARFAFDLSLTLPAALALLVVIFGLKNLILFVQKFHTARVTLQLENRLKRSLMSAVFSGQWKHLLKVDSGPLMNAVSTQARFAADTFKILSLLLFEVLNVAVYCVLALVISFQSFLLSAAAGVLSYLILRNFIGKSRVIGGQAVEVRDEISGQWMTDLTALKFVKGNRYEEFRKKSAFALFDRLFRVELRGEKFAAVMDTLPEFLMTVVVAAVLCTAFYVLHVPGERLIAVVIVLYRMNRRLMAVQSLSQRISLYLPAFEACRKIESDCLQFQETPGRTPFEGLKDSVRFDRVGFSYDGKKPVLQSLDFQIRRNSFTAIVGRSGSGKTTALDLLLGLLEPQNGRVLVDGRPLSDYDTFSWRRRISYVPQDPVMISGTVLDNIRMDLESATQADVERAARLAHADEFIRERSEGYASLVGDRGLQLSGGQKQRIALARALLRNPDVLVLDEATSALDRESEQMIQRALEELSGKLTIVVVAHRMSTIEKADSIYVLEDGAVADAGSMGELKARSAAFRKLYGEAA